MDPLWARVEELFHCALQLPEPQRAAWLDAQAGGDPAIQEEVRSLLASDLRHGELSAQLPEANAGAEQESEAGAGQRFGPYLTGRLLGSGGMGAVYLARRADGQFEQTVALKAMAPYLVDGEFERSLRSERQLLASLAHPNIARLLDGGVAPGGAPYLVMEYIDGQQWNCYCAGRKLPVDARLRLFLQVCEAVEFAHRNLIVHGDLKPANILVTADGTVKLLDFGTAKLVHDPEGSVTQFASLTPRYASPEQSRGERVNTQSDVFSLGVILYESLTGAWPFGDPKSTADGMSRVLHGREADAPTQVLSEAAAAERSISRDRLRRLLRGDLSTVLLKMLAPEPARRYGSVREIKEDLDRFLQGRPVEARPHTAWHTARRFAVRHWPAVLATALTVVAMTGLTVLSVYQSAQARAQAVRAQRVSEFVKNTFLSATASWASPLRGKHDAIQVSDILDSAAARLGEELGSDPAAEADLRSTLGSTYAVLGEPGKGAAQLALGLRLLPRIPGGAPRVAASLYANLCDARSFQGNYADALAACRQAVALYRVVDRGVLGAVLHDTAFMAVNAGEPLPEAEAMYREARQLPRPNQPTHPAMVDSRLGMLRLRQGDLVGGERLLHDAEPVLRGKSEPMIEVVPILYARAFDEDVHGRYAEAVRLMTEALELVTRRQAWFMEPDERALQLAAYEALAGKGDPLARLRDVEKRLRYTAPAPVDQIRHHLFAGMVEARRGSGLAAEQHLRAALAIQGEAMSRQPDLAVEIHLRLMQLLRASGRQSEAAESARQGLLAAGRAYGGYFAGHPFVVEMQREIW